MEKYETRRLVVQAEKFDLYRKPWPRSVETVVGDIGVPHPVIIGVQGNVNLNHGDWIVYMPMGVITMGDQLFNTLFVKHGIPEKPQELSQVHPIVSVVLPPLKARKDVVPLADPPPTVIAPVVL